MSDRTRYCSRCLTTFIGDQPSCPNLGCRSARPPDGWGMLLEPGDVLDRHYRVQRRLAIGGAGVTYLAREVGADGDEVGPALAVKVLYAQRDQGGYLRRLSNEAQILQELNHRNIVELRGFVARTGHSPYLVTRFERGGSLLDHVARSPGPLGLREVAHIGVQLCDALEEAHRAGVVHRDLKPENILLADVPPPGEAPHVRVTDFGIAKVSTSLGSQLTRVGAFVGTPQYAAPEQFRGETPTTAADVYSLGAVLLFCILRRPLLPSAHQLDLDDVPARLEPLLPPRVEIGQGQSAQEVEALNAALAATMVADPGARASLAEVRKVLKSLLDGTPLPMTTTRTAVPDLEATPPPRSEDEFAGILSDVGTAESEPADGQPPRGESAVGEGALEAEAGGRRAGWLGVVVGLVAALGLGCGGGAAWWLTPWVYPAALQETQRVEAQELRPGTEGYRSLVASLRQQVGGLAACRLAGVDRLVLEVVVAPGGAVQAVRTSRVPPLSSPCVRSAVRSMTFVNPDAASVRATLELELR